ncbi:MAG: hypothetical protein LBJ12_03275 [Oscillospiraceae bacterium]|jgi:Na+-transporting NADH:ubiquinone oxidoreductase subunit D|nr:hypothetical protein [Oscillospiraceae bacterium]
MPENKSFWERLQHSAIARNPILIQMLSVCTVMAAGTLKVALLLSVAFCAMFFVTQTLANLFMTRWKRYFRAAAYAAVGTLCALGIMLITEKIDPELAVNTGVYITMLAVSGITVLHCEKTAINVSFRESLQESVVRALGYCFVMVLVGSLRELLSFGALYGHVILPDFGIAFFAHPASTLLMLGFLAALLRIFVHRYGQQYVQEVALKISETPVLAAQPEPADAIPEDNGATVLPDDEDADEIPRPVDYMPLAVDEDATASQPDEITAQPAALEETQQSFEELMAELRQRYLDE